VIAIALMGCFPLAAASTVAARPDGAVRLTAPPAETSDQNPAFSPDGSRLLFTRFESGYNDGPAGLFLLDLDSGQATRLTPAEDQDNVNLPGAAWILPPAPLLPGRGAGGQGGWGEGRILFSSDRSEADDLWCIAPDGTDFDRITTHTGLPWYIEPSWSPDGQWIVFEASRPGGSEDGRVSEIWKVRADGTGLAQLTGSSPSLAEAQLTGSSASPAGETEGGNDDRQPNWSPAGDRILFQRRALPDGQWDIYTIAPDGSGLQNVTDDPEADETDASWSPGGSCIVYSTDGGALSVPNIFAIAASGGQPVRVTFSETREDGAPSWSPDGQWIAFESHEGEGEDSPSALWRIGVPEGACQPFHVYLPLTLTASSPSALSAVDDFLYQLQGLDLAAIGDTAYDLVVMDYSADGDDETAFTGAQIAALKHSPGGEKIVLAYMSIGEAEDYRFYWQDDWTPGNPAWLDVENPGWEGNYKVHYWDQAWQAIILSYTDWLLDAGFDGAYLDIIDAYEYYAEQGRTTAAQEMAGFVAAIRAHAHARDPDFYIFPQNAPELASLVPAYLNSVDGIGQEDIYYGYDDDDVKTEPSVTAELEGYLDVFKSAGKLVLTVDYATTPAHVSDAYARSQAKGYVPFGTVRDLDQLTVNPGHEPD
jgi:uncharacterized protein (TIGR01370 family)